VELLPAKAVVRLSMSLLPYGGCFPCKDAPLLLHRLGTSYRRICLNFGSEASVLPDARVVNELFIYSIYSYSFLVPKLRISFEHRNLRWGASSRWIFPNRRQMRFEWLALLAFKRINAPSDSAWVTRHEVSRLPSWAGRSAHNVTTNVGRYLQQFENMGLTLVAASQRWKGPYRLDLDHHSVTFDVPLSEVRKRLRIHAAPAGSKREELYRFTASYAYAQTFVFRGKLIGGGKRKEEKNAFERFMELAGDDTLSPTLRLIARLGAVQVLFRIGRFKAARDTLLQNVTLLRRVPDRALKAQFYVSLAWSYQRATSGVASNRAVERAISMATAYAEASGDRAALGLIAHRTSGYLTKKGLHWESINHLLRAIEIHLVTGNWEMVQAFCGNMGSVMHRLGPDRYQESRKWLLLGINIARLMRTGADDAHGEMILAKIHIESSRAGKAYWLLKRAERIATHAGNAVNLGDVKMVWGFWYQHFGSPLQERDSLISALRIFRSMKEFDHKQKERYMAVKFPEVWASVLARL